MRHLFVAAASAVCVSLHAAETNIVENGSFSNPLKPVWNGGNFGGGEGKAEVGTEGNANSFLRLEKSKGPGGVQILSRPFPLNGAKRFRFSLRFRGNSSLAFIRYRTFDGKKWQAVKGPTGKEVSIVFDRLLKGASQDKWNSYEKTLEVPKMVLEKNPAVMLQFQAYPRKNGETGYFEVDDISIEPLESEAVAEKQAVSLVSRATELATGYEKVDKIFPWEWEVKNGLFYRNGRPYFFAGWGDAIGAGMEGAAGVWLARLQGIRFIGTFEQTDFKVGKIDDTRYEVTSRSNPGWISWQRESARFGMLTEPHPLVSYSPNSSLGKFVAEHPEWKEIYFDLGHYVGMDTGNDLGRKILVEARRHYFGNTFPYSGVDYCELGREPGIENCNERMREDFRKFVRTKYANDLQLANKIWGTSFAGWNDVIPLHLDKDAIAASAHGLALRRHVRSTYPNHYWDFLRFIQLDTANRTRMEFDDMRKAVPGLRVTIDMRAHHSYTDGYCAFDPELVAPYEDICHVHHGYASRTYNRSPWHEPTLATQTAYPFFAYGYMTRNTDKPVVQSEDIISQALLPGSDAEAMADNDFARLHKRPWKFKIESSGEDGLKEKWFEKDFDDSAWGEVKVPGAWDDQIAYKGRTGIGWYRARFKLDNRLKYDYLDGSRRFLVHGKGVAQRGTLWLNGHKVGEVKGWSKEYSFDVGALLDYGGENEIVWRVTGDNYQNGLRFYCHVLCSDMLNSAKPFGEKQYAQMYWTYMMRGTSGVLNWNWHKDALLSYLPDILVPLETAAGVALESIRSRRSNVAYLYGYLSERGLPFPGEDRHHIAMKWYNALEFLGTRADIVSERTFANEVTPEKYPLLVVPETSLVDDATYEHFKKYLAGGGHAVITTNAMRKTFSRYEPTGIDALSKGVTRLPADLPMEELMDRLAAFMPPPPADQDVRITSSEKRERPLVERLLAGGKDAKVLYLNNWGGFDHPLEATLPPSFAGWKMTPLRGAFKKDGCRLSTVLPSQDVAACLLTRGEKEEWMASVPSAASARAWKRILKLNDGKDTSRPNVLWACERHFYPYLLDRFDAFGFDNVEPCPPREWTKEILDTAKVVVIAEGATKSFREALKRKDFVPMLKEWVAGGGSLYVTAFSAGTINAYGSVLRSVSSAFGMHASWASVPKDEKNAGLGDPWQILSRDIAKDSPLAKGVEAVQLFTLTPMKIRGGEGVVPVVKIPGTADKHAGDLAMGAVEFGKGRVFVSADAMFAQPMRIECADNAALLENVVGWLVRKEVTDEMREEFRTKGLFLDKACFE